MDETRYVNRASDNNSVTGLVETRWFTFWAWTDEDRYGRGTAEDMKRVRVEQKRSLGSMLLGDAVFFSGVILVATAISYGNLAFTGKLSPDSTPLVVARSSIPG